jgi:hypothetical protein
LLVALAASDGEVPPAELDLLVRIFDLLGLEQSDVYSQVHALSSESLTLLRTAGTPAPEFSIPRQALRENGPSVGAVVLNPELIKARLDESARAASYLAGIFTDDDAPTAETTNMPGQGNAVDAQSQVAGLDAAHTALFCQLRDRLTWSRDDFDRAAAELGLLPDGALETLNEAAFEAFGEPVCEGSDPMDINHDAIKEMLA